MLTILFICHGNICRSTMAESVMTYLMKQNNLSDEFHIQSAATSREEIGHSPHYGTVNKLREVGIPVIPHKAVQMTEADYDKYDYIIGMEAANIRNINRIAGGDPEGKVYKLLAFAKTEKTSHAAPQSTGLDTNPAHPHYAKATTSNTTTPTPSDRTPDVADPWYTGDFDATYRDVLAGCEGLLAYLVEKHRKMSQK